MKFCNSCGLSIPARASLCTHCKSYQDIIRRNLHIGQTSMALLVALLAVGSTAVPQIAGWWHTPNSNIGSMSISVREGEMTIVASNSGDKPGSIDNAQIDFVKAATFDSYTLTGFFPAVSDRVIEPGQMRSFVITVAPLSSEAQAFDRMLKIVDADVDASFSAEGGSAPQRCWVYMWVVDFYGKRSRVDRSSGCVAMFTSLFPDFGPLAVKRRELRNAFWAAKKREALPKRPAVSSMFDALLQYEQQNLAINPPR